MKNIQIIDIKPIKNIQILKKEVEKVHGGLECKAGDPWMCWVMKDRW